jgi:transcription initiation factor TFIIIB Brf1 subunit/transcription initiation factor TFIIB
MIQLRSKQELGKVSNRTFLRELQNRLREKKIKERELAKVLSELVFTQDEQELSNAYDE